MHSRTASQPPLSQILPAGCLSAQRRRRRVRTYSGFDFCVAIPAFASPLFPPLVPACEIPSVYAVIPFSEPINPSPCSWAGPFMDLDAVPGHSLITLPLWHVPLPVTARGIRSWAYPLRCPSPFHSRPSRRWPTAKMARQGAPGSRFPPCDM